MFGVAGFDPWTGIGGKYEVTRPRVIVVGDLRFDAPLTDRECVLSKLNGTRHLIFDNFDQAVLGQRHWENGFREKVRAFWERTLFYNYNVTYLPGAGRPPPTREMRLDRAHARLFRKMLETYKPTHVIVWGFDNWHALVVEGVPWAQEGRITGGEVDEPYRAVILDGHPILATRIAHPAASFSYQRWSPLLARFLAMSPEAVDPSA
jgi:hypothetical protein